ncbi:RNA polymerase sigma factor [Paenibacillus glycanilyticus]|uniref:RNA polymerase sigma factor n=1 Tax=Paenibacillus glycanilyticus TaxID=126569 RepID=UPI0024E0E829|nr:sigma-70 family RNA polymerase sigma factor [Paenibacillus glycanilyticus]
MYQRRIFIYCCRMLRDEQDAEDAAQDIFVRAYESIHRYKPTVGFTAWLYKIAYRHCLNLLRRSRLLQQKRLLFRQDQDEAAESPEQIVDRYLFGPPLDAVWQRLTLTEHNLLILSVFEEKTVTEIADIIGRNPESVKKRITRTKQKVRDMLKKEEEQGWRVQQTWLRTKI